MACTVCVNNDDKPVKMVSAKYFVKHIKKNVTFRYIIMTYLFVCKSQVWIGQSKLVTIKYLHQFSILLNKSVPNERKCFLRLLIFISFHTANYPKIPSCLDLS